MNGSSPRSFRLYRIHLAWNHAVQHSQPIHLSIFLLLPIGQTRKEHSSQTVSESDSGIERLGCEARAWFHGDVYDTIKGPGR